MCPAAAPATAPVRTSHRWATPHAVPHRPLRARAAVLRYHSSPARPLSTTRVCACSGSGSPLLYFLSLLSLYYSIHLSPSSSKNFFSKSLLRISLGPWVWLLVHVAHLALIGCSLSAFIAPWLFISCDFLATPCLKYKLILFTAPWSLHRRLIRWRLMWL